MKLFNDFEDCSAEDIFNTFSATADQREGVEILVADYDYPDYEGSAYVLFRKDGKLYEVHGGHCSCYGLEGQWEPDEVTAESIMAQAKHYSENGIEQTPVFAAAVEAVSA